MFADALMYQRNSIWHLDGHKRLLSLFVVLFGVLPETPLPETLQHLTILVYTRDRVAWNELDASLDRLPHLLSVEILLLDSYYPLADFVDFCSSTRIWDFEAAGEYKEEVIRGMPLLALQGILSFKQFKHMNG